MGAMAGTPASFRTMISRGVRRRCPVCGEGRIFRSFLKLRRSCTSCGWLVEREPGAVTGPMYLIAIVSQFFAVFLFLLLWLGTDWTTTTQLLVALPLITLFSLIALPVTKGAWVAVEYYTDLASGERDRVDYDDKSFEREP